MFPFARLLQIPSCTTYRRRLYALWSTRLPCLRKEVADGMEEPLINELLLVGAALGSTETYTTEDGW